MMTTVDLYEYPVAHTIFQQLGGILFFKMLGGQDIVVDGRSLMLTVRPNKKKVRVKISLKLNDLYHLEAWNMSKRTPTFMEAKEDIDAENLQTVFSKMTGYSK
jgi:hypothetical protein